MKNKYLSVSLTYLLLLCTACSDQLSPAASDPNATDDVLTFTCLDLGDVPGNSRNARIASIAKDSSAYRNLTGGVLSAPPAAAQVAFVRSLSVVVLHLTTGMETIPFTVATPRTSVHNVALSPNGQKITFTLYDSTISNPATARTTYIANANGTSIIALPVNADVSSTASFSRFSPDASRLALFHTIPENTKLSQRLLIVDTNGDNPPQYVASTSYYWKQPPEPATCEWSPDGTKLVYSLADTIRLVDRNGSDITPFSAPVIGLFPAWSPDGTKLVFSGAVASQAASLFSVQSSGVGTSTRLTDIASQGGRITTYPQWSPNGKYILYTVYSGDMFRSNGILSVLTIASRTTKQLSPNAFAGFWTTRI